MNRPVTIENVFQSFVDQSGFTVGRCGNVEIASLCGDDSKIRSNAGFYGDEEDLKKFKKTYFNAVKKCDVMMNVVSCPSFTKIEDFMTACYLFIPQIPYLEYCDIYIQAISLISRKYKIGFVSSFVDDMKDQAPKMEKIWNEKYTFNNNNFVFVKSHNTSSGNPKPHKNYQETLDDLAERVLAHKDVNYWMIGAGCYGLPLASILKDNNKNSMYVGGLIQVLFGILGGRWRQRKEITKDINFHWLGTSQHIPIDQIPNYMKIEDGCYI
jgi:hypothetical protein